MAQTNKYRVHEVAKDFNIKSNSVIDLLGKYFEEPKKHQTALTDEELDIVFETLTQENELQSFDEYFKVTAEKKEEPKAQETAKKKADEEKPGEEKENKKAETSAKKPADGKKTADAVDKKPSDGKKEQPKQSPAKPFEKRADKKKADQPIQARTKGDKRTIDTRINNVDLDKYNEKYEEIAPENARMKDKDSSKKQKINQKSKQYRKQGMRSGKKETESERLARIAAERAKKTILVKIGDEITVGELASRLKMTAPEVIKKLFSYGIAASINETIDFDTAAIVATELGAKVEKEVVVTIEDKIIDDSEDDEENLVPRSYSHESQRRHGYGYSRACSSRRRRNYASDN